MKRIHETLFILHKCSGTVQRVHEAYEELYQKGPLFSFNHFSHNLYYYVILEAVSFLHEYDNYFTPKKVEKEYQQRVKDVRTIAKPLYLKIRSWKDLRQYRNKVIAHGWRDPDNNNRLTVPHLKNYDVPKTNFELQLLKDLIRQLVEFIEIEFKTEADWAAWYGYSGDEEQRTTKDLSNINTELQKVLDEMNETSKQLDKSYDIRIQGYYSPEKGD